MNFFGLTTHKTVIAFGGAMVLSLFLTPSIRSIALKFNKVEDVQEDRWHQEPVPSYGGVAIWISWTVLCSLLLPLNSKAGVLILGAFLIFLLGFLDDLFGMRPILKFIGQIIIASLMVKLGIVIEIIPYPMISIPLTIFWIVAITNAFNLLDNMDGLSSGIAAISSFSLFLLSYQNLELMVPLLSMALAGSALGFLRYNFNPARIFMGDCGSMFLGFSLSVISIAGTWQHASNLVVTMLVPLLVLSVPIFDTTFVAITRKIRGIPVSQGGLDHISHRLVALGMTQKKAVLTLYSFSILFGGMAIFYQQLNPVMILVGVSLSIVGLFSFGLFLGEMEVYAKDERFKKNIENTLLLGKRKKIFQGVSRRRIMEVMMDIILISVSFFASYLLRFEGHNMVGIYSNMVNIMPWVIIIKITALYFFGVYKSIWKYIGTSDLFDIIKAVTLSTIIIAFTAYLNFDFIDFSKSVLIIDWLLCVFLISGFRLSIRFFKDQILDLNKGRRKIIIIGAGDTGSLLLKEIQNNPESEYIVVGFIDDDDDKKNLRINGVKVLGNVESIPAISQQYGIEEAVITIPYVPEATKSKISSFCGKSGLKYKYFKPIMEDF
jgi:UDP-GlcNAc:undecaprenyl-phosphate GlcNAc-1-phosphate transferase